MVSYISSRRPTFIDLYFRHGSHIATLRHAAVCALDLANKPSNADNMAMFIEVRLKPDHQNYPPERKFTVQDGFTWTMDEFEEIMNRGGGKSILQSSHQQHQYMKKKGALGVVNIMIKLGDITDVVRVVLPTAQQAKQMPRLNGDWGKDWVSPLQKCS